MCVILIGKITKEQHKLALQQNGDGFSLFTEKQGLIKSPKPADVAKAFEHWGIWHYRIATSGTKNDLNVHPFPICGGKYLLYHNGILGKGKGNLSDTHALANTLQDVNIHSARTIINALSESSGRFVIASAKDPHDLYLYGKWEADEGILMSHKLYTYTTAYNGNTGKRIGFNYGGKFYGDDD